MKRHLIRSIWTVLFSSLLTAATLLNLAFADDGWELVLELRISSVTSEDMESRAESIASISHLLI